MRSGLPEDGADLRKVSAPVGKLKCVLSDDISFWHEEGSAYGLVLSLAQVVDTYAKS